MRGGYLCLGLHLTQQGYATAAHEAIWLRKLLIDIGYTFNLKPVKIIEPSRMKSVLELDGESISTEDFHGGLFLEGMSFQCPH